MPDWEDSNRMHLSEPWEGRGGGVVGIVRDREYLVATPMVWRPETGGALAP